MIERRCERNEAVTRHPAIRRFQPDDAAERGWLSDGSAGVRAERARAHPGRHGDGRSSGTAARFFALARNAPVSVKPARFSAAVKILATEPLAWTLSAFYFLTFGGFVAFSVYLPTLLRDEFALFRPIRIHPILGDECQMHLGE